MEFVLIIKQTNRSMINLQRHMVYITFTGYPVVIVLNIRYKLQENYVLRILFSSLCVHFRLNVDNDWSSKVMVENVFGIYN